MNIWLVMLLGGMITFSIRFSFIYLFGKFHIPETVRKALHYVPPAVLSAITFPELFLREGHLDIAFDNHPLFAGMVAIVTAWFSSNTLLTILVGMLVLWMFQFSR
jgi:branched-subunit amino acid transport protein